jgi:hypothetical protein
MNQSDESPREADDVKIIPYFFCELITRIIPGLTAMALCFYWAGGNFNKIKPMMAILSLVFAWMLGIILDSGGFLILKCMTPKCFLLKMGVDKDRAANILGFNQNHDSFLTWEGVRLLRTW